MKTVSIAKPTEIEPGVVLKLCPEQLTAQGAKFYRNGNEVFGKARTQGRHLFMCLLKNREKGVWIPLLSHPGVTRQAIPEHSRSGRHMWVKYPHYYEVSLTCEIPNAIVLGAVCDEGTRMGQRDRLSKAETFMLANRMFPEVLDRFTKTTSKSPCLNSLPFVSR